MSNTRKAAASSTVLEARAEASVWITQLHGPNRSADIEAGFRRWLSEKPENAAEFEGLNEVWDLVASDSVSRTLPRLERWEHTQESRELKALRHLFDRHNPPRRSLWPQAAAILITVGIAAFFGLRFWYSPAYSTAIGEQRTVQLNDNTRVSLNSNTHLVVSYRNSERRVRLDRGEAFFEVAKDPTRPFKVIVGDHQVTALGTSFIVQYEADRTAVTLIEGKVAVTPSSTPLSSREEREGARGSGKGEVLLAQDEVILTPGQRLTFAKNTTSKRELSGSSPKIDIPRIEAVTAWRRGEVMLDDTPLANAVAEMNRYDKTTIVIDDPAIAGLNVSGLYHTGDSEGFARSIAKMYRLQATESEGQIHLKK